jgi:hypothetical protein
MIFPAVIQSFDVANVYALEPIVMWIHHLALDGART